MLQEFKEEEEEEEEIAIEGEEAIQHTKEMKMSKEAAREV